MKPIQRVLTAIMIGLLGIVIPGLLTPRMLLPAQAGHFEIDEGYSQRLLVRVHSSSGQPGLLAAQGKAILAALTDQAGAAARLGPLTLAGQNDTQYLIYQLAQDMSEAGLARSAAAAASVAGVISVELEEKIDTTRTPPNDPFYGSSQPGLNGLYGIDVLDAWDLSQGSQEVVIAVIDTGVTDHPDLDGRRLNNGYDFISNPSVARDGNGWDNDAHDPGDSDTRSTWHGTHVTGIINAVGNNAIGIAGVSWNSRFIPVRVLGKNGGSSVDLAYAIRWAAGIPVSGAPDNPTPARVINMSLGSSLPGQCPSYIQAAITDATAGGAVVVVSAGNSSDRASKFWPSNCDNVIAVANINPATGSHMANSNTGPGVTLGAPGVSILSTLNDGAAAPGAPVYGYMSGTSMAAPHVSGVISLMLAVNPALTHEEVLRILEKTASPYPSTSNCTADGCGYGLLNANAAIHAAQPGGSLVVPCGTKTGSARQAQSLHQRVENRVANPAAGCFLYLPQVVSEGGGSGSPAAWPSQAHAAPR